MGNFHPSKCYFLYVCLKSSIQQWSYSIFVGVKRSVKSTPESKRGVPFMGSLYVIASWAHNLCKSSKSVSHACLEQLPMKKKFLSQVFYIFMLYCIPLYSNNWFWNQNQAKFWENAILIFLMQKIGLILQVLNLFSPLLQFFLTFGIELMVPTDSQILVDDFRHQNFGIWTILSWIMAIFMKK